MNEDFQSDEEGDDQNKIDLQDPNKDMPKAQGKGIAPLGSGGPDAAISTLYIEDWLNETME